MANSTIKKQINAEVSSNVFTNPKFRVYYEEEDGAYRLYIELYVDNNNFSRLTIWENQNQLRYRRKVGGTEKEIRFTGTQS